MSRRILIAVCVLVLLIAGVRIYAHHLWNPLPQGTKIDQILIEKSARRLSVFTDGKKVKSYRVALGRTPVGAKQEEGDMKTPEGFYTVDGRESAK